MIARMITATGRAIPKTNASLAGFGATCPLLFAEDMGRGPAAGRSHIDLARIGLGVGDELRDRLGD